MIAAPLLCLAAAVYFEARGEPLAGQFAVAEVVLNRRDDPRYPDTICGVVTEDRGSKPHDCQFSFACDGRSKRITDWDAFKRALAIAEGAITMGRTNITAGAVHYHAVSVNPVWSRQMTPVAVVGGHIFLHEGTQ